ncbi:unnamed protein product [Camellia sinensis]|uniref:ferritin-1, chloroplastic-like n=1 Tax=Camellia sinensis TaxID=4442 RepID=UPI0010357E1C|nr:ferritin-1, chloroplastic-like [Camellia sinensis]
MELALSLEKLTNEKLLSLHGVAAQNNDPQMTEFIEREFLAEQVEAIKKIADFVTQLRLVGKGHGMNQVSMSLIAKLDLVTQTKSKFVLENSKVHVLNYDFYNLSGCT